MKLNKKAFFRIHSWIGIKLSILFFIVCLSGTFATVSHEMDWLFNPAIRVSPQGELVSRNLMVANVRAAFPDSDIAYWSVPNEPYLCNIVQVYDGKQGHYVFVNPYTGTVQGSAKLTFQRFFRDLHYYLFVPFQVGHFTVLIFGFMLLFSMVTALVFYKKWYRKLLDLKTGKGSVVLYRSLHRLVGVWSVPAAILFSVTGIWYFAERVNLGGLSTIANTRSPELSEPFADSASFAEVRRSIDLDQAVAIAQQQIPGLEVKDMLIPFQPDDALYLTGKSDVPLVRNRANRVYIHPTTYEVLKVQKAEALPAITWLNDIADPLHFGYWGGLVTKLIWFVFGLGISSLVLTGIWISQKRKVKGAARIKAQKMGPWKYVNWIFYGVMLAFMYIILITRYHASVPAILLITAGWGLFIGGAWYLFGYQMKKVVQKELA
ncbi:MAG: PepSY-associated TM helix domain-containing protein [Bacteroidota bacterium]